MIATPRLCCLIAFSCCIVLSCSKNETVAPVYNPPPVVEGKTYTSDEITAFKQMTLYATGQIITKWTSSVSVYLEDTAYLYLSSELDSVIHEINVVLDSSFSIQRTGERAVSTIQVYLTDRATYLQAEPAATYALQNSNYVGYGYINWNGANVIIMAAPL